MLMEHVTLLPVKLAPQAQSASVVNNHSQHLQTGLVTIWLVVSVTGVICLHLLVEVFCWLSYLYAFYNSL